MTQRFADDSVLEIGEETLAEVERKQYTASPAAERVTNINRATNGLKQAIGKSKNRTSVVLPVASHNLGTEVRVQLRRLNLAEIASSYSFPARADYLVNELIRRGNDATASANSEYEVDMPSPAEVVKDIYGEINREAAAALYEFQAIVCCIAVIDPETRLYYTQEEVDKDPQRGVLVWDVDDADISVIFDWVFQQEEAAEDRMLPFRDRAGAEQPLVGGEGAASQAERASEI